MAWSVLSRRELLAVGLSLQIKSATLRLRSMRQTSVLLYSAPQVQLLVVSEYSCTTIVIAISDFLLSIVQALQLHRLAHLIRLPDGQLPLQLSARAMYHLAVMVLLLMGQNGNSITMVQVR